MAASRQKPGLIAIIGPTASGKTELAIKIAREFSGEIIAADSRTIYKGADIGTSKPTLAQQKLVPHWGLDLTAPGKPYSAAKYKKYAQDKIRSIHCRKHLPILVGGTGLYIEAVLFDYKFRRGSDLTDRKKLEGKNLAQLQEQIQRLNYKMPANKHNKRHLIRTIESEGQEPTKAAQPTRGSLIIGLMPPREELKERINQEVDKMFKNGVVEEAAGLRKKYGLAADSAGIIYSLSGDFIDGGLNKKELQEKVKTLHWQYARRQITWFKKTPYVHWFSDKISAYKYLAELLNH